jgi:hypothetical protein
VLLDDGGIAKFQATSLDLLDADGNPKPRATPAGKAANSSLYNDYLPPSNSMSHAQSLKKGAKVIIMKTDNVEQRAPHLIGQVGIIKDVPQHPNTWFKVKFTSGHVFTFRPSALRLWSEGVEKEFESSGYAVNTGADGAAFGAGDEEAAVDAKLLSTVDADSWVNLQVMVKMGKYVGVIGTVLRSGNGWVQLQTETEVSTY